MLTRTALALLALTALTPTPNADACGGSYDTAPRILRLSSHGQRSFVVWSATTPAKTTVWKRLVPMSYDSAMIAGGEALAQPIEFTIVGRDGTKIVTGKRHVMLRGTFAFHDAASAIEVPATGQVAIQGAHADAKWVELDQMVATTPKLKQWVAARGLASIDSESIYVTRVTGTNLETLSAYDTETRARITFLRRGETEVARRSGSPLGIVEVGGERRLVLAEGASTSSIAI